MHIDTLPHHIVHIMSHITAVWPYRAYYEPYRVFARFAAYRLTNVST